MPALATGTKSAVSGRGRQGRRMSVGPDPDAVGGLDGALLAALFAESTVGLHVLDNDLRMVRVNDAARNNAYFPPGPLLGRHLWEVAPGLDAQLVERRLLCPRRCQAKLRGNGFQQGCVTGLVRIVHHCDCELVSVKSLAELVQDGGFARPDVAIDDGQAALVADGVLALSHALGVVGGEVKVARVGRGREGVFL